MINLGNPILYGYFRSTAAYRVRIALGLKGLYVSNRSVHLRNGEQEQSPYRSVNPAGLVPYWIDGDFGLGQSLSIIEYIDETHPDPPLLPVGVKARAVARELALVVCCDIHPIGNLRVVNRLIDLGVDDTARNQWSRSWIEAGFASIEARLSNMAGPFAFGDRPTLADICIVPQIFNARRFGVDLEPFPRIREIDAAATTVPAFAAAAPDRQPDAE